MSVHQTGMIEPMMVMGMMDDANAVGVNYSTNRSTFPPPQAHAAVPNTMPNHQTPQVQTLQNHAANSAIVAQLLQPPIQQPVQQVPQPPAPIQTNTQPPDPEGDNVDVSKPKKARKKRSADASDQQKADSEVKLKKKKCLKDKPKTKPKKSTDGTVSLLGKKGKTLDAQAREIALNVAEYFKREAELGRTLMPLHSYQKRAAAATGISTATLRKLEGARREIKSERVVAEGMVENPFPDLDITDTSILDTTEFRHKCKKCSKSRKFFCNNCCSPNPHIQDKVPRIKLPVKIDIIKHQTELDGRSTCPQAVVLAPEDVTVYTFPFIPDYDKEKVVLVFPGKDASTLKELVLASSTATDIAVPSTAQVPDSIGTMITTTTTADSGLHTPRPDQVSGYTDISTSSTYADLQTIWTNAYFPQAGPSASMQASGGYTYLQPLQLYNTQDFNNQSGKRMVDSQESDQEVKPMLVVNPPFERAVFVDSPWNQTKDIIQDDRLKDLRRVEIKGHDTLFWRCQEGLPTSHLSTIEAIYYFMREYHEEILGTTYLNEYDNLLFFFVYFYHKIREKYQGGKDMKRLHKKMSDQDGHDGLM
ncbi:uncharacterized protein LOC143281087 [Babylonia areolata]|uniref:uncharacterized protein LOC143281087 n=1 Tax=Babylonia areolata TaxID=304850 RepID=UPI003FD315BC